MSSTTNENVIHVFPAHELPENLMQISPRPADAPYYCSHEAVQLDDHERTVHCARCRAALDPFDFILNNAKTIQLAWDNHRKVQAYVADLNKRVDVLKKEEKRLRDMVKRIQEKIGIVDVRGKSSI